MLKYTQKKGTNKPKEWLICGLTNTKRPVKKTEIAITKNAYKFRVLTQKKREQ